MDDQGDYGLDLYRLAKPFWTGRLKVAAPHELHLEQWGNPAGAPLLYLHGGPGFPWHPFALRLIDPAHYRIVAFDQRGSYRSTPLGALEGNTTPELVADIERIRRELGIERWLIYGGSWGSALALAYAQAHPERARGLVLWGIYLGHLDENVWNFVESRRVLPEAWQALADQVPEGERHDLFTAYERRIFDPDPATHMPALDHWLKHNLAAANFRRVPHGLRRSDEPNELTLAGVRIALAYYKNAIFLPERGLLANAARLAEIPGVIVHGRVDYICPIENAFHLSRAWPRVRYLPVADAGHSAFEPEIAAALKVALEDFKKPS
ncbi:MAG: prolyl aminopeptidase [Kiloniellales bacterium]